MSSSPTPHFVHDTERVSGLIGLMYEAAAEPSRWTDFAEQLAHALELRAAIFMLSSRAPNGRIGTIPVAWGLDAEVIAQYEDHFAALDPHLAPSMGVASGSVYTNPCIYPDEDLVQSEFFRDFYLKAGLRHGFVAMIENEGPASSLLACHRGPDQPEPSDEDLELLRLLVPHLQTARMLATKLGTLHEQRRMTIDLLDRIPVGLIFVDEAGAVLHANRPAHAILQQEDGLSATGGRLTAERTCDTHSIRGAIDSAVANARGRSNGAASSVRVPRPSGRRPFDVTALPIDPNSQAWSEVRAAACVLVSDGEPKLDGVAGRLSELYGLSQIEAGLAIAIASGATVREWAKHRGVSVETVRWQLKQVFAKTGIVRQPDLMRLVLMGPGLIR